MQRRSNSTPPNYTRDAEMAELREMGWTYSELGARYALTKSGVQAALWRFARPRDKQFGLSARAFNALCHSIGSAAVEFKSLDLEDIAVHSFQDLLDIPNLGLVSAYEIAKMLWRRAIVMNGLPASLKERLVAGEA